MFARRTSLAILVLASLLAGCAEGQKETLRTDLVRFRGNPVTLEGEGVTVGSKAPDFRVVNSNMQDASLSDYRGKIVILNVVPSLDTSVCSKQTRTFNEKAAALGDDVAILTVSMDLPMAQKRWCAAHGIDRVKTLSDYKYHDFSRAFGLRIRESGLLARSVYVIDPEGVIRYEQIVPELTTEPDYDDVLAAVDQLRS